MFSLIENGSCVHCGKPMDQYINTETGDLEPLICVDGFCIMTKQERSDYELRQDMYVK